MHPLEAAAYMHRFSFNDALRAGRLVRLPTVGAVAVLVVLACLDATAWAQTAGRRTDPAIRSEFREPVTLASKDGVLEVRLTAQQDRAILDTVATPVENFLLFDYEVIRGTASDGKMSGGSLYPAPVGWRSRWRQANCRQPARGHRFGKALLE